MAATQQAEQIRSLQELDEAYKQRDAAPLASLKNAIDHAEKWCGGAMKKPLERANLSPDLVKDAKKFVRKTEAGTCTQRAAAELKEKMEEAVKAGGLIDSGVLDTAGENKVDQSLLSSARQQDKNMKAITNDAKRVSGGIEEARTSKAWKNLTQKTMLSAIENCKRAELADYGQRLTGDLHEIARLAEDTKRVLQDADETTKQAKAAADSELDAKKKLQEAKAKEEEEKQHLVDIQEKVKAAALSVKEAEEKLRQASKEAKEAATKKRARDGDDEGILQKKVPKIEPLAKPKEQGAKKAGGERELLIAVCSPSDKRIEIKNANAEAHEITNIIPQGAALCHSIGDLDAALKKHTTRCFLFIGHGDAKVAEGNTLAFTDKDGNMEIPNPDALAKMLGKTRCGNQLELVFLNGCETKRLGDLVREAGVPNVVCWETKVETRAARIFSNAFFKEMVGTNMHYRAAFEAGKQAVLQELKPGWLGVFRSSEQEFELIDPDAGASSSGRQAAGIPVLMDQKGELK